MKLNNKGWGLADMIIYTSLILLFLLIAASMIRSMYETFDVPTASQNNYISYYKTKEKLLADAALRYEKDYYDNIIEDNLSITLDTLVKNGYISKIYSYENNNKCNGYAIIYNTYDNVSSSGYLYCDDYISEDY